MIFDWTVMTTPGNGRNDLPQNAARRLGGTHSGSVTLLRITGANDRFYLAGSVVLEYEGTYRFNAVPNTPLKKGQVTAAAGAASSSGPATRGGHL